MYLSDDFIMEKLNSLPEHKMAKDIFGPLLKKIGLEGVKFTGGPGEEGIDLEYYEKSTADDTKQYAGIQFKKGDITYSAKGTNGTVKEIKNQAEEAFAKDICEVNSGGVNHLSRYIVATTGEINENARKMINKAKNKGEQTNISYWDKSKLANDIRNYYLDEFVDYFDVTEEEDIQDYYTEECIVTEEYFRENYAELISNCEKCMRIFSWRQSEIVKAIVNYYFETNSSILTIGDLLYELGKTEDDIREDLLTLQRFECIDCEETISLKGKATALIELSENIIEEMMAADEYEGNEKAAKILFYNLIE